MVEVDLASFLLFCGATETGGGEEESLSDSG